MQALRPILLPYPSTDSEEIVGERYTASRRQIPLLYAILVTSLVGFHVATSAEYVWMLGLAVPTSLLILYRLHHWWVTQDVVLPPEGQAKELRRTHLFAVIFGFMVGLWAFQVLATGTPDEQKYAVLFATLGAVGASYGLNALPRSANALLLLILAPLSVWLILSGQLPYVIVGISLVLMALFVHGMIRAHDWAFVELVRSREEQKRAQEALLRAQKLDAMGQLTGGVAHDFNNLLSPIMAGFELLQIRGVGRNDEQAKGWIELGLESAERARTLVQRLLLFARQQPLQLETVDLGDLVRSLVGLLESTLGPRIRLLLEIEPDLPSVRSDVNQLELALLNLAVNARDAMANVGSLTIEARRGKEGARPPDLAEGHYVALAVRDTGCGMDSETLERAVEPFFSTKGVGKGTGLGLSMVHGLVGQLGGAMSLESRIGEGTAVTLWLPAAEGAAAKPVEADASATAGSGLVLLVDDEELVRASTRDLLWDLGYDVVDVGSAEEALRVLEEGVRPHLLLTDHLLPGMTGLELAERHSVQDRSARIIISSGHADLDSVAGRFRLLPKPFLRTELAHAVASALEDSRPKREGAD